MFPVGDDSLRNSHQTIEFDYPAGQETKLATFPTLAKLFARLKASRGIEEDVSDKLLTPYHHVPGYAPTGATTWKRVLGKLDRFCRQGLESGALCGRGDRSAGHVENCDLFFLKKRMLSEKYVTG